MAGAVSRWRPLHDLRSADELQMPSLASIDTDDANLASLVKVIFEYDTMSHELLGRNVTYVRLVTRAVRAYERARVALVAQIEERTGDFRASVGASWRATDEFETLFNSIHRALRILHLLKQMQESPVTKAMLPKKNVFKIVDDLRDASEHIEERLIGKHPHAFTAYDRGFEYAGYQIEYPDVATWLEHMHSIGRAVV